MNSRIPNRQKAPENSDSGLVSSQFQPRPFAIQPQSEEASPQQQETPDLQTQLERAKRFGPDFSRVRVRAQAPPVTFESKLFFGEQRNQEDSVTDSMAKPVRSMPAYPVNLPPIQRRDAEWVGNQPNPLAARMMPVVQRRDAESVGNQPSPLAARMMPVVQRRDAESVVKPPNPLAAKMMPVVQRRDAESVVKPPNPLAARMMPVVQRHDAESVVKPPNPLATRMMPVVQRQSERAASIQSQPWIQRIEEQPEAKLEEDSLPVQAKLENATIDRLPEVEQESEKEDQQTTTVGKLPTLDVSGPSGGEKLKSDETKDRKAQGIEELPSQLGVASPEAATGKTLSDAKHSPNEPNALASAEPKLEARDDAGSNEPKVNQLMESAVGQPQSKTDSKPNAAAGTQPKQQPTAQGDSSKNAKADGAGVAGKDGATPDAKGVVKAATKHIPPETADVAQKAQTLNNSRKEEVAAKKVEATKAVEETSAKKDTGLSASQQLASAQASFAPPQPKAMFATSSEGISALQPEEVLGAAGNGLVIYQTDNPEKSLAAANAGAFVHQIPEDKAANAREQQRIQAEAAIAQFTASGSQRTTQLSALGTTIGPRIQAAAGQATASVDAAIAQNQSAIINGIDQARAQVQSQAQGAKTQIPGQHATTVAAIQASTTAARDRLQTEYQASLAQLSQLESAMARRIAEPFNKAASDFRAAGVTVGNEAIQIGETFKGQYAGESPPEPSNVITEFLESFDRDTYVTNWRQAKIKAAGDVAAHYRDGLNQSAGEKAKELSTSQSEVLKGMQELVTGTRSELQVKHTAALKELSQSEQSALKMATQTLNSQLQSIEQNLNTNLASLDQMQATQLSQLDSLGQQQKLGINAQAGQVTAALQQGVNQATTSLQGAFGQFVNQAQGIQAPNLEVINSVIAEAQGQLDSLMATTQTELETGINKSEQGIVQQTQQTVGSINTAGQQAASSGSMIAQEFTASMTQEVQNATQAFSQLQNGHTTGVNGSAQKTADEFKNLTGKVQQQLDGVVQNLNTKLGESVTQLENGLRGSLKGSDQNPSIQKAIDDKAKEAADQVQPAWKSVVKVLIDIAITVAVTVAIAALAASGVGLVAAIGLAALIGAGGALVKQGANDLIDGKLSSWQTYATQAGFGAVGGVLQLVGLRGAEKAAGLLTNTVTKTGAKFGIEALGETGADISQRLAAGEQFSLAMLGVSFGTSLLGGAGGEALNGGLGKLGAMLGVNKIDNAALKTGGEFVTDTISETATDVTSQVVFEGKELSWQTVGESAGTSAFGNLAGRGANRAYGDRLRNLGRGDRATSDSPPQLIDPNTNQPIGQTPTPTQLIDPNTNQPIGQTPTPPQLIDPNTNQPVGQTPTPPQLIDPNTNQPVGQTPTPPQLIDPNTNQPMGQTPTPPQLIDPNTNQPMGQSPTPPQLIDPNTNQAIGHTSTPTKSKNEGLTPIPSAQSKEPSKTPKDSNSETETSPEKSPAPQTEQTNNVPSARTKIEEIKDFKKLREMVEKGELGDPKTAQQTLQEARNQIISSVLDGEGGVRAILKQRYPNIEIEFKDLGSKGFGSDRDITVKVTGGKDANENARASVEGVREAYNKLRELGFEPDKALDSNFYTELHEGNITPTSKAEAAQILHAQSVTSLAEMRMNMSPEQWQAYKQQQLESLGLGKDATGVQDSSQAEARDRLQQQLQDAENLAARLQDKSKPKEQLLEERQAALLKALEQNASPKEIRQLMAEVKLLEPDAYGTRAAVEGVVDYQQAMKGDETGDKYWDIYTGRADKLPDDTSERFAVLSQEASASLAKMYSHSHGETGNSVSDVLAMAKYLGRIDHAHYEAGLSTSNNPVIDTMHQLMATKANGGSQADTVGVLKEWAQANNLSHLTDQQIQDAWVAQAQTLGQDLVVKLRSSEQMAHVFAPKDVNDSSGSGSDSSTSIQSGDSLPDATATSDKTNSAETKNQTELETLSNTPEKPKDADESSSSLESTEVQDTTKVKSLNPDLEQTLTMALPRDLQGKVPINVDPDLPSNTVRVHYEVDANGLVTNVHMRVGPNASAVDIQLHAQTVRLMQNYSGFSGRIRILKERIQNWISKNGEPPVGSRAWEAKLEVDKLPRIIDERLERLSKGDLDADAQANLRADIENLQQQLATHQKSLDEMDTNPGAGFVAAQGLGTDPNHWRDLGLRDRVAQVINRTDLDPKLVQQISETLQVLNEARLNGKLNVRENQKAFTDLVSKLGHNDPKKVSESLAELAHAVYVLQRGDVDPNTPIVIGAKYNQQLKNLPKIDVENVEADTYYKTADGVIHITEVKDTPNAFVSKLPESQFDRYKQWVDKGKTLPTPQERVAEVYIQRTGPGFDEILDSGRFGRLTDTIVSDVNKPFMKIGEYNFSLNDLREMERDALEKIREKMAENQRNGLKVKPSDIAKQYFGSVEESFKTLGRTYGNKG